jgi:hypothetical protein
MSDTVKQFLATIKQDVATSTFECNYSDSLEVSQISFGQQKTLVTSTLEGITSINKFMLEVDKLIQENVTGSTSNITILDRIPIVIQMKLIEKGADFKVDEEVTLGALRDNFSKAVIEPQTLEYDAYEIKLRIPTLDTDVRYHKSSIREFDKVGEDDIGKCTGIILAYELPKFVESITFNGEDIIIDEIPIDTTMKIIETLPSSVTDDIHEFVSTIRDYDEKLLTVKGKLVDFETLFFERED